MAQRSTAVDQAWESFRTLPYESRGEFLERLLADPQLREEIEDLLDLTLADERSTEPTRPFAEVLEELRAR